VIGEARPASADSGRECPGSLHDQVIIWLNGTFGRGKTIVCELRSLIPVNRAGLGHPATMPLRACHTSFT
jgi:hypothetical protein